MRLAMSRLIPQILLWLALLGAIAAAQQLPWTEPRPDLPGGKVKAFTVESKIYGQARTVWVYTPVGYDPARKSPYDLVVCFDGAFYGAMGDIPLPTILDNLTAAGKLPPMVALLIDNGRGAKRIAELGNSARFAQWLGEELMPWLHQGWNVTAEPARVIVTGSSAGGLAAAYVAFRRPELFGNVLSQSGAFWRGNEGNNDPPYEWLTSQFKKSPKLPLRFYLEVGALENVPAVGFGPIFLDANRRLRDTLRAKGYPIFYKEVPGGRHEPAYWKNELADGLLWLTQGWPHQP